MATDTAPTTAEEVLARVAGAGLHSVRVSCVDQHGLLRTKTIGTDHLPRVLEAGVGLPGSLLAKDTGNQYAVSLWSPSGLPALDRLLGAQDMVMVPDPATFQVLPWAEGTGWLLCDLVTTAGEPIELSTRGLLARSAAELAGTGHTLVAGLELELHLFEADSGAPIHPGWELLGEQHADRVHDRLQPIRAGLAALGLAPRSIEVELGPGQIEMSFPPAEATATADRAVLIRAAIAQLARRAGMRATFLCRPGHDAFPSGWHLHQSLADPAGTNAFATGTAGLTPHGPDGLDTIGPATADGPTATGGTVDGPRSAAGPTLATGAGPGADALGSPAPGTEAAHPELSPVGRRWVAGLLEHAAPSCLLTTPTVNGYKRYRPASVAPDRIAWSRQHRGAMIRVIGGGADPATHIENRVGDPAANPYLYLASQVVSGLDGLRRQLEPPPATASPYAPDAGPLLPRSLGEAIDAFRASAAYRAAWGDEVVDYLVAVKSSEWRRFLAAVTDWELREYGELF